MSRQRKKRTAIAPPKKRSKWCPFDFVNVADFALVSIADAETVENPDWLVGSD